MVTARASSSSSCFLDGERIIMLPYSWTEFCLWHVGLSASNFVLQMARPWKLQWFKIFLPLKRKKTQGSSFNVFTRLRMLQILRRTIVRSSDTDIFLLLLHFSSQLNTKVYLDIGTSQESALHNICFSQEWTGILGSSVTCFFWLHHYFCEQKKGQSIQGIHKVPFPSGCLPTSGKSRTLFFCHRQSWTLCLLNLWKIWQQGH